MKTKTTKPFIPVTEAAVVKRIRRAFAKNDRNGNNRFMHTRGEIQRQALGDYWGVHDGAQIRVDNLEKFAREWECLSPQEYILYPDGL
jgi:hypothetical protein